MKATSRVVIAILLAIENAEVSYMFQGDSMRTMNFNRGPKHRRRATMRRRRIVAFFAPIIVFIGIPAWFLLPPQHDPGKSDAVLVIAGASDGRHEFGAQLIEAGVSENFVVSNPAGAEDAVGFAHCSGALRPESAAKTWCMKSDPVTTTGEALAIDRLAKQEGWTSVIAVTDRPHNHRVRTNLNRCTDLESTVVSIDDFNFTQVPVRIAREVGGYIKFIVTNPC